MLREKAAWDLRILSAITVPAVVWWLFADDIQVHAPVLAGSLVLALATLLAPTTLLARISLPFLALWQLAVPAAILSTGNEPGVLFACLLFGAVAPLAAPWREAVVLGWFLAWFWDHEGPMGAVSLMSMVPLGLMTWASMVSQHSTARRAWEDRALLRLQSETLAAQRDRLEEAIAATRSELLAKQAADAGTERWVLLGRLADGVARELEAPLAAARSVADTLDEPGRGRMQHAIARARALVDDLQRVAHPPAPGPATPYALGDLRRRLDDWALSGLPDDTPLCGSVQQAADVFRHLEGFCAKEARFEAADGGVRARIDCEQLPWPGAAERVFEPFGPTPNGGGSRLALAAVRSDVLGLGGQVDAVALSRGGTRLFIWLERASSS